MLAGFQKREEESAFPRVVHKLAFSLREMTFGLSREMSSMQGIVPALPPPHPPSAELAERGRAVSALCPLQLAGSI